MNASDLWQILLTAGVPADQLKTLAYDIYHQKSTAEGNASQAVAALAPKLAVDPRFAYEAFKRAAAAYETNALGGDRKQALEWLAHDYQHSRAWAAANPITKAFVEKIAHNVTVIKNAMAGKQGPPPPAGGKPVAKAAAVAAAATTAAVVAKPATARIASVVPSVMQPKKDWRPSLVFFVGGTIASFILSIRNARHRYRMA